MENFIRGLLSDPSDPQLPQYDPEGGWNMLKYLGQRGAAFTGPGGVADAFGLLGEPSVAEHFRRGDYGSAALTAAGAFPLLGPLAKAGVGAKMAMAAVPMAGKAAKAVQRASDLGEAAVDEARVLSPLEQRFMDNWGSKHEYEAKNLAKAQALGAAPKEGKKNRFDAVEPTVYRQMAKDPAQGDDAVIKAALAGEHLKPTGLGGYVGAPRTIDSPQALGALRRKLDREVVNSAEAVEVGDPYRLGTWYLRAKRGMNSSNEPWQLQYSLDNHGTYSAGVSPEAELGFALKHWNSRALGEPGMAFRTTPMDTLDRAHAEGRIAPLADKTDEYRSKLDPRNPVSGLFGVNDFRAAQNFGYTNPQGKPWKAAVSGTMHPFMDAETALLTYRTNNANAAGRNNWSGPQMQELPWVYQKAQDIYERGRNARFSGDPLEGRKAAIREANNTFEDYLGKHAGAGTYELVPGASTNHIPGILSSPDDIKTAYGNVGRWDVEAPGVTGDLGAGRRDALYSALGLRQIPTADGWGAYKNTLGDVEGNPLKIARPLVDFPTGGEGQIAPLTERAMDAIENYRGVVDAQEAYAYNMPNTMAATKGKTGILADTRPAGEPATGVPLTKDEMAALNAAVGQHGFGATATGRGALVFPYGDATLKQRKAAQEAVSGLLGSSARIAPARPNTGYGPAIGTMIDGEVKPIAPHTGEATMRVLEKLAGLPQDVALKLSESEDVRKIINAKKVRDDMMFTNRADIQNTRDFLSSGDMPKVVALIRKGMAPAAALAALGYSATAFAGEDARR